MDGKTVILDLAAIDNLIDELQSMRNAFAVSAEGSKRQLIGKMSDHELDVLVGENGCLEAVRSSVLIAQDYGDPCEVYQYPLHNELPNH